MEQKQFRKISGSWISYIAPVLTVLGSVGVTVVPFLFGIGFWQVPQTDVANFLWENKFNLREPIFWFLASIIILIFGNIENFINRYCYGQLEYIKQQLVHERKELRQETSAHESTKKYLKNALSEQLRFLLFEDPRNIPKDQRVTVYRNQTGQDQASFLRRIYRFSENDALKDAGRFKISSTEGVVGVAWAEGEACIASQRGKLEGSKNMNNYLSKHGCALESTNLELSMETRSYFAKRIDDNETGKKIAVVVYESTKNKGLDRGKINDLLSKEHLPIAICTQRLGVLDKEFNGDRENGNE